MGHIALPVGQGTGDKAFQPVSNVSQKSPSLASHPQQGDYKRMALLTCEKFPSLKDSDPSKYWV